MEGEPFDEAELGSTTPPPPDRMYEPARNAADFDDFPPGWEEAVVEGRKYAGSASHKRRIRPEAPTSIRARRGSAALRQERKPLAVENRTAIEFAVGMTSRVWSPHPLTLLPCI